MYLLKLKPYVLIVRPGICIGTFILVLLSTWIAADHGFPVMAAILGAAGVALNGGAGSVFNDIIDMRGDRNSNPQRMLPSGFLTRNQALGYYLLLLAASLLLLWRVNIWALSIGIVTSLLLFIYSCKLRELSGILSNVVIALSVAAMLAFGAVITRHLVPQTGLLFGFGFSIGLVRELLGDVANIEGDKLQGRLRTLPMSRGTYRVTGNAITIWVITACFLGTPFVTGLFDRTLFAAVGFIIEALAVSLILQHLFDGQVEKAQMVFKVLIFLYPATLALATVH